ncbi:hypothetical protein M1D96_06540 [Pseudomonas sp. D1-3]
MSEIQRSPADCVKCGIHYDAFYKEQSAKAAHAASAPEVAGALANYPGARPVVVMDINMSFGSMVRFMVKWAIASIPALLILFLLLVGLSSIFRVFTMMLR